MITYPALPPRPIVETMHVNRLNTAPFQHTRLHWPQAAGPRRFLVRCLGQKSGAQLVELYPYVAVIILLNLVTEPRQFGKPQNDRISTVRG